MNDKDLDILLNRIYHLETAYKGFTTRLKLIEAEIKAIQGRLDER